MAAPTACHHHHYYKCMHTLQVHVVTLTLQYMRMHVCTHTHSTAMCTPYSHLHTYPHYLIAIKVTGNKESYYVGLVVRDVVESSTIDGEH